MKMLVTGGAGFIGSNIVEELLKHGHHVRVLDNFSTGSRNNLKEFIDDIDLIEGDLRDFHAVNNAVKAIEVVFHEAALPSVPRSIKDPITTHEVNATGTLNLLIASKENGVRRVVFASSSSVYGDSLELPKHEQMIPKPISPYAISKLFGEYYCRNMSTSVETIILRYFNVFGPKQNCFSQYSAVIPKFINNIINDQTPLIYGDGEQTRDFTYISNVVEANILAATHPCESPLIMNCAASNRITLNELVNQINCELGKDIKPIYGSSRPGDIKHSHANIDLIKSMLSYSPSTDFKTGLINTIKHFTNIPAFSSSYIPV